MEKKYPNAKPVSNTQAKRVNLVSIKVVRENSLLYSKRIISSPRDVYMLTKDFLENEDREKTIVICLDIQNQPTDISTVSIGGLNSAIVTCPNWK